MKRYLIILIIFLGLFNNVYGQSPSRVIDSLVKFKIITPQDRPVMQKELSYIRNNSHASYHVAILGGLENIMLQKTFHIEPHKTGIHYYYNNAHIDSKSQDSINTSLRLLLEKIKKADLLTSRVYTHALKGINSGHYVIELELLDSLTEMSERLEWMAPDKLLPVAQELHKNGIVTDSSFLRLKDDITNGKIESAFQLNDYCRQDRIIDMSGYADDPNIWLEQMHRDIASILPGLDFSNFSYTEVPDTSSSLPGVRLKVSLTCNGRIYKHISLPIIDYKRKTGEITPRNIFINDFYRIFNKVLTDQQSPYRLHNIMFSHITGNADIRRLALIALKDKQVGVFMKNPCMSYMLVSMDSYDHTLTSAKIDSIIAGWERMGLFSHLSNTELDKAIDNTQAADPFSTSNLLSNFPGVVYNLHDNISESNHPYASLLKGLAKITKGEFNPARIAETKTGQVVKLQYSFKGKMHSFTFPTAYGWMDTKFPAFVRYLSRENNLSGNFYTLKDDDTLVYLTPKQYDNALKTKLLEFALVKKRNRL